MYNSGESNGLSSPTIYNCNFINNHSNGSGGCIFNNAILGVCNPTYTNCTMAHNVADDYGAGMYSIGKTGECNPTVTNCLFYENDAYSAGGMYNLGSVNGDCSPIITNCTFYGNTAIIGGGIYCNATDSTGHSSAKITNCIIWGNTAPTGRVMRNIYGTPVIKNTLIDVDLCSELNSGAGANVSCGVGVIYNEDPLFISTANNEFHLMAGSPAIDTGNNLTITNLGIDIDRDSLPRIFNGKVDLGCFENNSNIVIPPTFITHPSDREVCEGDDAFFTILASGTPPLSYQWYKNGSIISNAINKSLFLQNVASNDIGEYHCVISGPNGDSDTSNIAELSVLENKLVTISIDASTTSICSGDTVTITATTQNQGSSPYFEWKVNGQNIQTGQMSILQTNVLQAQDSIIVSLVSSEYCTIYNPATSNMIIMTGNGNSLNPSIVIETDHLNICGNESLIFTSSIQNGGNNPTYAWKLNGLIVGNEPNLSINNLSDLDQITCTLTSNASCVSNPTIISNILTLHQNPTSDPSISIQTNAISICSGETIIIESTISDAGDNPSYKWYINGEITNQTNPTFQSNTIQNGDIIYCELISTNPCVANTNTTSNSIIFEITNAILPNIVITSNPPVACNGGVITFDAQISHGGNQPHYKWYVNGVSQIDNTPSVSFTNLPNNTEVYCKLTSSLPCASGVVTSNTLTISSYPNVTASLSISKATDIFCEGSLISFTTTTYNEGENPVYTWYKNNEIIPNENNNSFSSDKLTNNDIIWCVMNSSHPCVTNSEVQSNKISIQFTPLVTPEISLIKPSEYCENNFIQIVSSIKNGGSNPQFKWILNDIIQEETTSKFTITEVKNTDNLYAILTSDSECSTSNIATSSTITFDDAQSYEAKVEINNPLACSNDTLQFKATPINGGSNPIFKWYKNNQLVSNIDSYEENDVKSGDLIYCKMTSNKYCVQEPNVFSDTYTAELLPTIKTSVALAINFGKICIGDTLLCIATATNGGSNPYFNWYVNNQLVENHTPIQRLKGLTETSQIQVYMESSINCPEEKLVASKKLEVIVEKCPDATIDLADKYEIQFIPNPTQKFLNISYGTYAGNMEILLYDIYGKLLFTEKKHLSKEASSKIDLTEYVSSIFLLVLKTDDGIISKKVLKIK